MCLLDEVLAWDRRCIRCRSATHRDAHHPLRAHGRLGAASAIEYAAQAMAVHGALLASATVVVPRIDFLAAVRRVQMHLISLDAIAEDLLICAERIEGDERTVLYDFSVLEQERVLVCGRATVVHG